MPKQRTPQLIVTGPARRDIEAILRRSIKEFGAAASDRYRLLIRQAMLDILSDPNRPGSKERPEILIEGARTYHLLFSRNRVEGQPVKDPRHFLLYRRRNSDGAIELARILDDVRDLDRQIPDTYRRKDSKTE